MLYFLQFAGAWLNVCLLREPLTATAAEGTGRLAAGPGCRRRAHHQGDGLYLQPGVRHRGVAHHALHSRPERIQVRKIHETKYAFTHTIFIISAFKNNLKLF
jgi:hypothetical protein